MIKNERILVLHNLLKNGARLSPIVLVKMMAISYAILQSDLRELKKQGMPLKYSYTYKAYYYDLFLGMSRNTLWDF